MLALANLLNSSDGLRFLESKGIFANREQFKEQLKAPAKPDLAEYFGMEGRKLVCSGQQIYVDYQHSVLSKIEVLREMERYEDLFPFFLWVDTDRSGSDNLMTKFAWPDASKKRRDHDPAARHEGSRDKVREDRCRAAIQRDR